MNTTSAEIVTNRIRREFTALCYDEYVNVEIDVVEVEILFATLQSAMRNILNEVDCLNMARTCGSLWVCGSDVRSIFAHAISNVVCASNMPYYSEE